jgi:flavin-dependent dehydrogenase
MSGFDVLVLGGGPAGALLALLLARRGVAVGLVHDGASRAATRRLETLAPSVPPLLASLGLDGVLHGASLGAPLSAALHWPGAAPGAGTALWPMDRDRFDERLRVAAGESGATLLTARATRHWQQAGRWHLACRQGPGLAARVLVDTRGRRASRALGPRTVAVSARCTGSGADEGLWIEAQADGWLWALASQGQLQAAWFCDAAAASADSLAHALLRSPNLLAWAGRLGPVALHDSTARAVADAAPEAGRLVLGDAAVALDPLSSQGVAAALRSALQAAAAVATALRDAQQAALAWRFHRQQQARLARQHQRDAAGFHARAAAHWPTRFWRERSQAAAATEPPRAWPALDHHIHLSAQSRLAPEAVLCEGWIEERTALSHPHWPAPSAWLAGEAAEDWLQPLQHAPRLHELLDTWQARFGRERTEAVWPRLWQAGVLQARPAA